MATFIAGLAILLVGGALYGRLCERAFGPDDRTTPAIEKADGVDYVPMPKWRNSLINLLNIAGTGPILGPIQGILFGPAAFVTIPIGCVIGGAVHDYFCGIVLSVTSGDTAMRSLRLIVSEALGIKTGSAGKCLAVAAPLFALAACLLVWAKSDADGFGIIWRYSGWANQTLGVCALVTVTIWLVSHGKRRVAWMPLVPLAFYAFITCTFLLSARIGFNLPIQVAYAVGAIFAIAACALSLWWGSRRRE